MLLSPNHEVLPIFLVAVASQGVLPILLFMLFIVIFVIEYINIDTRLPKQSKLGLLIYRHLRLLLVHGGPHGGPS